MAVVDARLIYECSALNDKELNRLTELYDAGGQRILSTVEYAELVELHSRVRVILPDGAVIVPELPEARFH